ncbi:MAG: hypothetical protein HYW57_10135 [Ignavibacteriales bacterium]|nr:hypothetical protein [Ignavibacteriales bacterium]
MNSLSEVSIIQFQHALTSEKVRTFQVIHLGLGLGVFGFGLVVLYLWFVQGADHQPGPPDVELIQIMSIVHAAFAVSLIFLSSFLYEKQFRPERLRTLATQPLRTPEGNQVEDPVEKCLSIIRTGIILRLAMLEAAAFFGLVVCTIAALNGVLVQNTEYAFNAITPLFFLMVVIMTFPTAQRLEEIFRAKITASVP